MRVPAIYLQNLIFLAVLSGLSSAVGWEDPDSIRMVFWVLVAGFCGSTLWVSFHTIYQLPKNFGFIYVLLLMTSISWVAYGFTVLGEARLSDSILLTFSQNLLGLAVLIVIVHLMTRSSNQKLKVNWAVALAARLNALPRVTVNFVIFVYAIMTVYRFSLGLFMSGTGGIMTTVSTLQSILLQLSAPIGGVVAMLGFLILFDQSSKQQTLGGFLVAIQSVLAFLGGRRVLIGLCILGTMVWILLRGIKIRRLFFACLLMVTVVLVAGPFFFLLRSTAQKLGIQEIDAAMRGGVLAQSFTTVVDEFSLHEAFRPSYVENIKQRAGFFDWTVTLQERVARNWPTRNGEIAFISIVEVFPRVFFPGKFEYLGGVQTEQKIQQWFALPIQDSASTILGYAIADGGWVGVIVYFTAYGALLAVLFRFMLNANFTLSSLWAASALFFLCFHIEMNLTGLIGTLRMLIIVSILDQLVKTLFWKKKVFVLRENHRGQFVQKKY
jgi:hypothetical protein